MLYDRTCRGGRFTPGLSHAWSAGGLLYRGLGRIDRWFGANTWAEGLDWILDVSKDRSIREIQYWGHGSWGGLWMDEDFITRAVLEPSHPLNARFAAIRSRLAPDALWWFRCCDVFGTKIGHEFAKAWTRYFDCRAAGHTYTINMLQSGLHVLAPGEEPTWSVEEGVVEGMTHAANSSLFAPNTISFLHGRVK